MALFNNKHDVGKTISKLRKDKGLTQADLAEKLSLSDKAISKWESGKGLPDIAQLPILAEVFGVTIDYLMKGDSQNTVVAENAKPQPTTQEIENMIESAMCGELVSIDKLIELNNFAVIKDALEKKPIHLIEAFASWIDNKSWKPIFKFAVDNSCNDIINGLFEVLDLVERGSKYCESEESYKDHLNDRIDSLKRTLYNILRAHDAHSGAVNDEWITALRLNEKHINLHDNTYSRPTNFSQSVESIQKCKQQIINNVSLKMDKNKMTMGLNWEYFDREFSKGSYDIVVIKLCVKLEAILKCDYHFTGEFKEMLDRFCSEYGREDDGWGYDVESERSKLFNRLRMHRNNIVHAEPNGVSLNADELKKCIEYVTALDES